MPITINLLGPVTITGATGKRPSSPARATEAIAFLALNPWDDHTLLDAAMWPGQRITAASRSVLMHQARTWLGTDDTGRPWVSLVHDDGYRLHPDVTVDVDVVQAALDNGPRATTTTNLIRALRLVRGQPLTGVTPTRYAWADLDRQELIGLIADAAEELATRTLARRDQSRLASWATAIAVMVEPAREDLWRLRLQAAASSAGADQVRTVIGNLRAALDPLGPLEQTTQNLIDQHTQE